MDSPTRPLLVYDGDCEFCRMWIARWRHATGPRVEYTPYQQVASRFPGIAVERFRAAVQWIAADGGRAEGADAVFRALACAPGRAWPLWAYHHLPGVAGVSEWGYRRVAGNRVPLARLTRLLWGHHVVPPGDAVTAWLFLRLLGVVFALAFASAGVQMAGLVGPTGILPAREYLSAVAAHYGATRYVVVPTLCWLGSGDAALATIAAVGGAGALALAAGIAPGLALLVAWASYLSLVSVGQEFFWFQWDALLLEAGFLALFLVPWRWRSRLRDAPAPPRSGVWLLRWLLFRLVFASAVVKLSSGDATWRNLTALTWHYQTQPLPPWTAWYAHQFPVAFQRLSAAVMFAIEGGAPFLMFTPRRLRLAGAAAIAGLQLLILVTGNYGVFNVLTMALCVLLLDDGVWPRWLRRWRCGPAAAPSPDAAGPSEFRATTTPAAQASASRAAASTLRRAVAAALVALSLVPLLSAFRRPMPWLEPLAAVHRSIAPFELSNSYGLFAVMTTERDEIVVEGSADGTDWRPYTFRWKPGDPRRRPEFVVPHMPRLDWQMWFASLSDVRRETWFLRFCERLLQGSPAVLRLLEGAPYPAPPRYVRAVSWDYRFTDARTRRATGAWWVREPRGLYCPVLTLDHGSLAAAPMDSLGNLATPGP